VCIVLLPAVLLQVMLFIGGVLDTEEEVTAALTPFGPIVRTAIVTNPAVSVMAALSVNPCATCPALVAD
jgi:hypothetical protein